MPETPLNPDAIKAARLVYGGLTKCEAANDCDECQVEAGEIIRAYLAVAQPEVTSVKSIPATIQVISWEEEPEHECWKLSPDETFVGLIVKSGRSWSPADKYTLNIERTIPHEEES